MSEDKVQEFELPHQFAAEQMTSVIVDSYNDIELLSNIMEDSHFKISTDSAEKTGAVLNKMRQDLIHIFSRVPSEEREKVYNDLILNLDKENIPGTEFLKGMLCRLVQVT